MLLPSRAFCLGVGCWYVCYCCHSARVHITVQYSSPRLKGRKRERREEKKSAYRILVNKTGKSNTKFLCTQCVPIYKSQKKSLQAKNWSFTLCQPVRVTGSRQNDDSVCISWIVLASATPFFIFLYTRQTRYQRSLEKLLHKIAATTTTKLRRHNNNNGSKHLNLFSLDYWMQLWKCIENCIDECATPYISHDRQNRSKRLFFGLMA